MKKLILTTIATGIIISDAAYAVPRIDVPKTKLTLTESQIAAIKNERGQTHKNNSVNLFGEDNQEELEDLLQARLREVDHITHFRDRTSLDRALTFSGLALQAWNPDLRHSDAKNIVVKNIVNYGFVDGFIVPTMAMINGSYAIGNPGFGNLLNTMLADITPNIADTFKKQYGIQTETNNQNFDEISSQGRDGMWKALMSQLDPSFFEVHKETEKLLVDGRLKPAYKSENILANQTITSEDQFNSYNQSQEYNSKIKEGKINDFINININGDHTAIGNYLKKIGKEDNSQKIKDNRNSGLNSTPTNNPKEKNANKNYAVFSVDKKVNAWECSFRCTKDVFVYGLGGAGAGMIASPVAAAALGAVGAVMGLDECSRHLLCGGDGTRRKKDEPKEQPPKKEEPKQPKAGDNDPKTIEPSDDNEPSTIEEDSNTMPAIPSEVGPKKVFTAGNKDLIMKVSTKEKNAQRKDVGVTYPTAPQNGD